MCISDLLLVPQGDVQPAQIMKRVNDSSGAKYSVHNEKSRPAPAPTPAGTSYTPIGRPDIAAMKRAAPPPAVAAKVGFNKPVRITCP